MFIISLFLISAAVANNLSPLPSFDEWLLRYEKTEYLLDQERLAYRKSIYEANIVEINAINSKNLSWSAGVNAYSDMTWMEFKKFFNLAPQNCSATSTKSLPAREISDAVDWRKKGVVTPVKNQGQCGSCWTFSTTGAVESAWAIAGNKLISLAEQQLVDCAGGFNNFGCNGGLPSQAFQYLMWQGGQELESVYAYHAKDEPCAFKPSLVAAKIKDEVNVTAGDESETGLLGAIHNTPTSVCYQVDSSFRHYTSGVFTSDTCKSGPEDVNHAVLAVGYGTDEDNTPYYIIKNSWGTNWGMDGYFWIIRDKNMCGISTCASYPIA